MGFNFKNAFVCKWAEAPVKLSDVASVPIDELVVIGIVKADGGFKVAADEKIMSSTNKETAVSHKLDLSLEVLTPMAPSTFINDLDNMQESLVFVDSDSFPDLDTVNTSEEYKTLAQLLEAASYALPEDVTATVLSKKLTLHIEEDVKYGSGKVVPFLIKGSLVGRTKDVLRKNDVPVIDE